MFRPACVSLLISTALSGAAFAQAPPYLCGPDCTTPGRYVLCNDGFDGTMAAGGGVVLDQFLEAACASFLAPAANFNIEGFVALFGPGDMVATAIELYAETGMNPPGMALYDTGAGVPASAFAGFSGLFFASTPAITDFRLCVRQQIDDPFITMGVRPIYYDVDGQRGQNTVFAPGMGWIASPASGDFILRAVVTYNNFGPWNPGGECVSPPPPDGGIADASPPPPDTGFRDGGMIDADPLDSTTSPADANEDRDGGSGEDATTGDAITTDASGGPFDASSGGEDASEASDSGGLAAPPPMITAISPREGSNATPVEVVVTGSGFIDGLSLKIGTITADNIRVPGATSILATIPANIAEGTYDVIVQNPDGQTDILPDGYKVLGKGGGAPVEDGCGCRTTTAARSGEWSGAAMISILGLIYRLRRRRIAAPTMAKKSAAPATPLSAPGA